MVTTTAPGRDGRGHLGLLKEAPLAATVEG